MSCIYANQEYFCTFFTGSRRPKPQSYARCKRHLWSKTACTTECACEKTKSNILSNITITTGAFQQQVRRIHSWILLYCNVTTGYLVDNTHGHLRFMTQLFIRNVHSQLGHFFDIMSNCPFKSDYPAPLLPDGRRRRWGAERPTPCPAPIGGRPIQAGAGRSGVCRNRRQAAPPLRAAGPACAGTTPRCRRARRSSATGPAGRSGCARRAGSRTG